MWKTALFKVIRHKCQNAMETGMSNYPYTNHKVKKNTWKIHYCPLNMDSCWLHPELVFVWFRCDELEHMFIFVCFFLCWWNDFSPSYKNRHSKKRSMIKRRCFIRKIRPFVRNNRRLIVKFTTLLFEIKSQYWLYYCIIVAPPLVLVVALVNKIVKNNKFL